MLLSEQNRLHFCRLRLLFFKKLTFRLQSWLSKWYSNHDGKKKLQKPNPWAKNDDGSYYKAALLSGPPGVGQLKFSHLHARALFRLMNYTRFNSVLSFQVKQLRQLWYVKSLDLIRWS